MRFDFTFVLFHGELLKGTKCIYMSENPFRQALRRLTLPQIFEENLGNHAALNNLICQLKVVNYKITLLVFIFNGTLKIIWVPGYL